MLGTAVHCIQPDANGNKIVPAGTPWPTNDDECLGYLLEDVDVTQAMRRVHTFTREQLTGRKLRA